MHIIRENEDYLWDPKKDFIGAGTVASVYRARNKITGDVVAVKCFNELAADRQRELEKIRRLDHRNLVKLLAIQKDKNGHDVIVMELCAGSLYTQLDEPLNAYGLAEEEFLTVFRDVTEGMNYLRVMNIVQRDIKPGNIMRAVEDGQFVYKLADFGAARELEEQEQFVSLYGTEEYLHPDMDMYEQAVLRRQLGQTFTSSVDLWSLGVTFYHTATGQLPFKPYGGRRNRETMQVITTQKASGVISGVQKTECGNIEWSRELPKTTRLSQGLKELITPILAGLLECKPESMWTFEDFYEQVKQINKMTVINVFLVPTVKMYTIYISNDSKFAHFQDAIAVQTEIGAGNQELIFEHDLFNPDPLQPCSEYPLTSLGRPIFLYRQDVKDFTNWFSRPLPKLPKTSSAYSLDGDYTMAKSCAAIMHYLSREQEILIGYQNNIQAAVSNYRLVANSNYQKLCCNYVKLKSNFQSLNQSLFTMKNSFMPNELFNINNPEHASLLRDFQNSEIKLYEYQQATTKLENSITPLMIEDDLVKKLTLKRKLCDKTVCTKKLQSLLEAVQTIYSQFRKDNTEQLDNCEDNHRMDKLQLYLKCTQGLSVFQKCEENLRELHTEQSDWHSLASEYRQQILQADQDIARCMEDYESLSQTVSKFEDKFKALKSRVMEMVTLVSANFLDPLYASFSHASFVQDVEELMKLMKLIEPEDQPTEPPSDSYFSLD